MTGDRLPRILLVENEPRWSQAAKAVLQRQGKYQVHIAADIATALTCSYADGFDLIIINAALALGDNASKFAEIVRLYDDKVLVISDVRSISAAIHVFKTEADYAEKPFEPKPLAELVASCLPRSPGITT